MFENTLQTRQQGSSFLTELKQKLLLIPSEAASAGTRYNVPLINSLVLYVGMQVLSFNSKNHSNNCLFKPSFWFCNIEVFGLIYS